MIKFQSIDNKIVLRKTGEILQNKDGTQFTNIKMENCRFIVCSFGQEIFNNSGRIKKYLETLSISVPRANVVVCISIFTILDPDFFNYNLKIHIERFGNVTVKSVSQKYADFLYFFSASRYIFYDKYIRSHPEVEYIFFCDDDSLILKNPFELLNNDSQKVHVMYDPHPYSVYNDLNYYWLRGWNSVSESKKKLCGMNILNRSLRSSDINNQLPWNVGLMLGRSKNLLPICNLIAKFFSCVGMFKYNAEQGLFNYIRFSGHLDEYLSNIHPHSVQTGNLISCPDHISVQNFTKRIRDGEIYVVHHYQFLSKEYYDAFDGKIKKILKE